ncbi:MAG: TlpA family protein disulfide reductase [Crocinitomicaceae bacterium]|nr:TlpA family protein disulfide reductase [Crocinitomicaceae bacterium]
MKFILFSFFFIFSYMVCDAKNPIAIKSGRWVGTLELTHNKKLFFELFIDVQKSGCKFMVKNGNEIVPLNQPTIKDKEIHVKFSNFNTELVFKVVNKTTIVGEWVNHLKANYSIPFHATLSVSNELFPCSNATNPAQFDGKWKTVFKGDHDEDAIGVFTQKDKAVTGTFLTETGDYRFLSGNVDGNTMYLSGFDGSHAYLFIAHQNSENKLEGEFLSGIHHYGQWTAERNEHFELSNPDSLTLFVGKTKEDVVLKFKNLDETEFNYPNDQFKNKVVIIQILGTWCANCMDETVYFKELYDKYHDKGLEILTVGYETGETFKDYSDHLKAFQQRFNLTNPIVVGGGVRKSNVLDDFPFLSSFSSYPTSIFIDRHGNVARIHTGFSGPSTGKYYTNYREETQKLIENLINQ